MRRFRYVIADVFTDVPLAGNQLAVFTDGRDLTDHDMQTLARETNLSETVFVLPPSAADADVRIRIFTPSLELPFAGHPTLGAAFVLGGPLSKIEIRLETGAGVVPVTLDREGPKIVFGRMEQPLPNWSAVEDPAPLLAALGVERSALPVMRCDLGPGHVYVALDSPEQVQGLSPDMGALAEATADGANCFAHVGGNRWKTRMFAPNHGVSEDPATGSAAGPLAMHLARNGRIPYGEQIEISQGAEINRPSTLYATAWESRVEVGGSAVIVARALVGRFGTRGRLIALAGRLAAVTRHVEAVASRVHDHVGIVRRHCDSEPRR